MSPVFRRSWLLVVFGLSAPSLADAKWKSQGEVRFETRGFSDDQDARTKDFGLGLFSRLEVTHDHRPFQERARVYGRLDQQDLDRTVFVVEELFLQYKKGRFRLRVGADLLNWTANEAFHPADIINARNLDSDVENYEKVGEPLVELSYRVGSGRLSGYFMPYYSRPIIPAQSSRLSFIPPGVDVGETLRMDAAGNFTDRDFGPQGALRLTQSIGPAELGIHAVHHMDRSQPELVVDPETELSRALFRTVTQIGGTYQHVLGAVIAKFEFGYRIFAKPDGTTPYGELQDRDHLRAAAGLEYGWLHEGGAESVFIVEAQSIFFVDEEVRRSLDVFQRDVLFGYRASLNDEASTELSASTIVDVDTGDEILFNLSITRRILTNWSISAAGRMVFANRDPGVARPIIAIPERSSHVRLFVSRFF